MKETIAELDTAIAQKAEIEKEHANIKLRIESLVADHNTAIKDENPEMLEATMSAESVEMALKYLEVLPRKKGGVKVAKMKHFTKYKANRVEKVEIKEKKRVLVE